MKNTMLAALRWNAYDEIVSNPGSVGYCVSILGGVLDMNKLRKPLIQCYRGEQQRPRCLHVCENDRPERDTWPNICSL